MTAQKISLPLQRTKRRSFEFDSVTDKDRTLDLSLSHSLTSLRRRFIIEKMRLDFILVILPALCFVISGPEVDGKTIDPMMQFCIRIAKKFCRLVTR